MSDERGNSDPWPYLMIDRAVEPAIPPLSNRLRVTTQHIRGGLVSFWGNCSDPRDLERLLEKGQREVVFQREEAIRRFALVMGVERELIDPDELHDLHILERREDGSYRVRGMSRYFAPLERRLQARTAAANGGRASAKVRKERSGSSQPRSAPGSGDASGVASTSASGVASGPASTPAQADSNTEDRGQRTEDRGQKVVVAPPLDRTAFEVTPPTTSPDVWSASDFCAWAQALRVEIGFVLEKEPRNLSAWFSGACMKLGGDVERLCKAFEAFGQDKYWEAKGFPFAAFMAQWEKYTPASEVD